MSIITRTPSPRNNASLKSDQKFEMEGLSSNSNSNSNSDTVFLARHSESQAGSLPDFGSWEGVGATASLADRVLATGRKLWDVFADTVGWSEKAKSGSTGRANAVRTESAGRSDASKPTTDKPTLKGLPPRAKDAMSGTEFMRSIEHLPPGKERDRAVLEQLLSGNIPDRSRQLKEIVIGRRDKAGKLREVKMHVMPDYLSIGSDKDNVRIPMTPAMAQTVADRTGTSLPTDRLVDEIAARSRKLHMAPFEWKPGQAHADNMKSIDYYARHDRRIDRQLGTTEAQSELVSGHKKDIVIPARDGRVAIYGGRWPGSGKRVQPYSNKHFDIYADYSHGARLISQDMTIDGKQMKLSEVLADPNLAPLVSRFPPNVHNSRYPVD